MCTTGGKQKKKKPLTLLLYNIFFEEISFSLIQQLHFLRLCCLYMKCPIIIVIAFTVSSWSSVLLTQTFCKIWNKIIFITLYNIIIKYVCLYF